jgi:hypothetical protein
MELELSANPHCLALLFLFQSGLKGLTETLGNPMEDWLANIWIVLKGGMDGAGRHLSDRGADPLHKEIWVFLLELLGVSLLFRRHGGQETPRVILGVSGVCRRSGRGHGEV